MSSNKRINAELTERLQKMTQEAPFEKVVPNGRRAAIAAIDHVMADPVNIQVFKEELQTKFNENPLAFYQDFVAPITPKIMQEDQQARDDHKITVGENGSVISHGDGASVVVIKLPDNGRDHGEPDAS